MSGVARRAIAAARLSTQTLRLLVLRIPGMRRHSYEIPAGMKMAETVMPVAIGIGLTALAGSAFSLLTAIGEEVYLGIADGFVLIIGHDSRN